MGGSPADNNQYTIGGTVGLRSIATVQDSSRSISNRSAAYIISADEGQVFVNHP
ncbi:hypothetical protein Barb6_00447 [Bacteroidales bacterium Barb6]|nr:hypothetical protein Barb6_00447 [Bacteroidales bacterium Barb6]